MKSSFTKLEKSIVILMIASILFVVLITVSIFDHILSAQQYDEINKLSKVIDTNIDNAISTEELIQIYLSDSLKIISKDIVRDLQEKDIDKIDVSILKKIKLKYNLSGVALFKDYGDDIVIEKSTFENEQGLSTKKWGFWYDAFRQLFDDNYVSIDKGISDGPYWVGPRSLAYDQEGYFIFTYYKVPGTKYLLNLYVNDKEAFGVVKSHDPNMLLEELIMESNLIDQVAVINVDAWNERFTMENRSKLQNYTIEYGYYDSFTPDDTYYINLVNDSGGSIVIDQILGENKVTKIYTKLRSNKVLVYIANHDERNKLRKSILLVIFISLIIILFVTFIFIKYAIRKFSNLLDVERRRLKLAEEYKHTVRILPSMIFRLMYLDNQIIVKHCEGQAIRCLDINPESSMLKNILEVFPSDYYEVAFAGIEKGFKGISSEFEYEKDGRIYQNRIEPIIETDIRGINEIVVFANDITTLRNSENRAKYMAYHDSLTDMPNRHYFKETVDDIIKSSYEKFAVAFIDLDGFKNVNDTAGHDVGDILLKMVSYRINNELDYKSFAARMGGDEFAVILRDYGSEGALIDKLNQLKEVIGKEYNIMDQKFNVSGSIGVSLYPGDGEDYTTLLKKADIALYDVKYSGKNAYSFYKDND